MQKNFLGVLTRQLTCTQAKVRIVFCWVLQKTFTLQIFHNAHHFVPVWRLVIEVNTLLMLHLTNIDFWSTSRIKLKNADETSPWPSEVLMYYLDLSNVSQWMNCCVNISKEVFTTKCFFLTLSQRKNGVKNNFEIKNLWTWPSIATGISFHMGVDENAMDGFNPTDVSREK